MDIGKEKIKYGERIKRENEIQAEEERRENLYNFEDTEKKREKEIREQLSKLKKNISSTPLSTRDEKKEIEKMSYPEKIGTLISLSFEKGIEEATSIAVSLGNPSLVDEFHDTLIDQYKDRLIKEGIINGTRGRKEEKSPKKKIKIILFLSVLVLIIILIFLAFLLF